MDVLPLDVITVNQFGAEQSHSLEDEDGNVNLTLQSGKQGIHEVSCSPPPPPIELLFLFYL